MPVFEVQDVDGEDYTVYANVETADQYAAGADHGGSWRAIADDEDKARKVLTATRTLDRQRWKGEKVDPAQPHAFPRKNTGIPEMEIVDFPIRLQAAAVEMGIALADGSSLQSSASTASNITSMSAGSVSLSFAVGMSQQEAERFPTIIDELIGDWLGMGTGSGMAGGLSSRAPVIATGTDGKSITRETYGLSKPL